MTRGAPRKFNATIPKHIDQGRIPKGVYWDASGNGRWYVKEPHPEGGRPRQVTVAQAHVRLSELHDIMESRAGSSVRGTVDWVWKQFEASTEFADLSADSKKDYRIHAKLLASFPTKLGYPFGQIQVDRLPTPVVQQLIEKIARGWPESRPGAGDAVRGRPSTANHVQRLLGRLFGWGVRFGCCKTNPARGVKQVKEAKQFKMPAGSAFQRALAFAEQRGAFKPRTKGACPRYLAPVMVIAYRCRLRGIEVLDLTEADILKQGIRNRRRKGSLTNGTRWTPDLRAAVDTLRELRRAVDQRRGVTPLTPGGRPLVVGPDGEVLDKSSLDSAWQRFIHKAMDMENGGVLLKSERFSLHGLKHRGVTDTKGTRDKKKDASGHVTDDAFGRYDHEFQWHHAATERGVVEQEQSQEFSGVFSGGKEKGAT
jgi:integrase